MNGHVLVVDDEPSIRKVLAAQLRQDGHVVDTAEDGDTAVDKLSEADVDVVITDLRMPGMDGMGLLRWIQDTQPEVPVIVLTAHGSVDTAVDALKHGAFDFLTKPFDQQELAAVVRKAVGTRRQLFDHLALGTPVELLGDGPAVRAIRDVLARVTATPVPVLVRGERGTGREVVARAVHDASPRAQGPFMEVHLGAMPVEANEVELFGEVRPDGTSRPGRVALADGGTLMLESVDQLSAGAQVRLLHLLQDGLCEPVGGLPTKVDVRVVATTQLDLARSVDDGHFREDLHYRLSVVPLNLPALRTRLEDLPVLADKMLARARERLGTPAVRLTEEALARLASHAWPGNLRELETVLERAALLADSDVLDVDDLVGFRPVVPAPGGQGTMDAPSPEEEAMDLKEWLRTHVARLERQRIARALADEGYNVTHAAKRLGISRRSLQTKMKEYGLRER